MTAASPRRAPRRYALLAGLLAALAVWLPAAAATSPGTTAEAARDCGTISFSGTRLRIVVLRGTTCATARRVAAGYARFRTPPPWHCFLARQGAPEKIACGYGSRGGDIRRAPHAFIGR